MRKGWLWEDTTLADHHGNYPWHVYPLQSPDDEIPCYVFTEEEMEALLDALVQKSMKSLVECGAMTGKQRKEAKRNAHILAVLKTDFRSIVMGEEHG